MVGSLCLLLLALGIVLWHERDFWFPETPEEADQSVESQPVQRPPVAAISQSPAIVSKPARTAKSRHVAPVQKSTRVAVKRSPANPASASPETQSPAPPIAVTSRTVLPPLEIEVVAGDKHRTVRPGSSSVRVDLQPGTPAEPVADPSISDDSQNAANVTSDASERVQMSADTSEIVAKPVRPNYPMLARQMKVQGSVILQAMIGRDGIIQDLHVVSGPHILASAAEDAVRQWHFKPHFEGSEPVETQAKITVNFTISTN
jgi:TonB family protein